MISMH